MLRHTIDLRAVLKTAQLEGDHWLHSAREACGSSVGATSSLDAEFVDALHAKPSNEPCDVVQASLPLTPLPAAFPRQLQKQTITEFGAVALVVAALCKRNHWRVRDTTRRGSFADYVLEGADGRKVGVLEVKGRDEKTTTAGVREAKAQVLKSTERRCHVGVVAFRGLAMHVERVR